MDARWVRTTNHGSRRSVHITVRVPASKSPSRTTLGTAPQKKSSRKHSKRGEKEWPSPPRMPNKWEPLVPSYQTKEDTAKELTVRGLGCGPGPNLPRLPGLHPPRAERHKGPLWVPHLVGRWDP